MKGIKTVAEIEFYLTTGNVMYIEPSYTTDQNGSTYSGGSLLDNPNPHESK